MFGLPNFSTFDFGTFDPDVFQVSYQDVNQIEY